MSEPPPFTRNRLRERFGQLARGAPGRGARVSAGTDVPALAAAQETRS